MKIEVIPGIIDLNLVRVVKNTPYMIWLSSDCKQKYPVHDGHGMNEAVRSNYTNSPAEEDSLDVYIGADEETIGVTNHAAIYTIIRVSGIENVNGWSIFSSYRKYGADYIFVRKTGTNWDSEDLSEDDWYPGKN